MTGPIPTKAGLAESTLLALTEHVKRSLIAVVPGSEGSRAESIGSGTLVRHKDVLVVLTAAHVAEDAAKLPIRLVRTGDLRPYPNTVDRHICHVNAAFDVGLLIIKESYVEGLRQFAVTLDDFAHYPNPVGDRDAIAIAGYPFAYREEDVVAKREQFSAMLYETDVERVVEPNEDQPGLLLHWGELDGVPGRMPHPGGISGGPVWWFPIARTGTIWTPEEAKIVGVVHAYRQQSHLERASSVAHWFEWFVDTMARLASE